LDFIHASVILIRSKNETGTEITTLMASKVVLGLQ